MGDRTLNWLSRYLDDGRPRLELERAEHAMFLSGYGEHFSAGYVGNWVKRCMEAAGIHKD